MGADDASIQFLKEPSTAELKAGILKVAADIKGRSAPPAAPEGPKNKGGRPAGYRKDPATGRWIPPGHATNQEASPSETFLRDGEVSVENCRDLLDTIFMVLFQKQLNDKILERGARIHAIVLNKHLPDYAKKYSDIAFLGAWWATIFSTQLMGGGNNGDQSHQEAVEQTQTAAPQGFGGTPQSNGTGKPKGGDQKPPEGGGTGGRRKHNFF